MVGTQKDLLNHQKVVVEILSVEAEEVEEEAVEAYVAFFD
jgi:hypothetical protein